MKQLLVVLVCICFLSGFSQESSALKKTDINGKVTLLIPEGFIQLTEQDLVQRFGMVRMPDAAYSSANNDVTITISHRSDSVNSSINYASNKNKVDSVDLVIEKSFYKASLGALYTEVTFINDEVKTINNKPFMVFEFDSKLEGKNAKGIDISTQQYNYIAHGFKGKSKFIVTFSCPLEVKEQWQSIAQQIIESINL